MVFELLFIGFFLASMIDLIIVLILAMRRRRHTAMRAIVVLGAAWVLYLSGVLAIAAMMAARPQRTTPLGQELCFDEMCFSVVKVEVVSQLGPVTKPVNADGRFYVITVRVSSRSRGRFQTEGGLRTLLWDSGKDYEDSSDGLQAWEAVNGETTGLATRLRPGESVQSVHAMGVHLVEEVRRKGLPGHR